MRTDKIDAIESYNDPNNCDRASNEPMYKIVEWDANELVHQTKADIIDYVRDEVTTVLFKINTSDEADAFETAKKYLEQFSAIEKEN